MAVAGPPLVVTVEMVLVIASLALLHTMPVVAVAETNPVAGARGGYGGLGGGGAGTKIYDGVQQERQALVVAVVVAEQIQHHSGGHGGSGIVVVRYKIGSVASAKASGGLLVSIMVRPFTLLQLLVLFLLIMILMRHVNV